MRNKLLCLAVCAALLPATAPAVNIAIEPADQGAGGVNGSGLTTTQLALLENAAATWERFLPGYQPGITVPQITVRAFAAPFDQAGNTFAEAEPDSAALSFQRGYFLSTGGQIHFDSADLDGLATNGTLYHVMLHEIAHVLGFGTLWSINGLSSEGSGQYVGGSGVTAYAAEFAPGAFFVPVELGGGSTTRGVHWNEEDGGLAPVGLTDSSGRDFGNELMTGWVGPNPEDTFLSNTTLASFEDLGYLPGEIPEPALCSLLLAAGLTLMQRQRKHRT